MAGHTTLITGGTRGIGRACALQLAADGHDVVLGYNVDPEAAAITKREVERLGVQCLTVQANLSTEAGIDQLFEAVHSWREQLDGVVNNAGATLNTGPLAETPSAVIRRVIEINLTSAVLVARRAVQVLPPGGVLVNISSGAATTGSPNEYVHYAAAKAGVDALTKGLAVEVAPRGIRVVGVAPGTVDTRIHADAGNRMRPERIAEQHPMGRVGTPEEIANAVAFVISPAASYVSGTTLRVAGGA